MLPTCTRPKDAALVGGVRLAHACGRRLGVERIACRARAGPAYAEPVTSTKETCLADMRSSFAEVMAVVDTIARERLTEVGVTDAWSVRDVLAHEAGY